GVPSAGCTSDATDVPSPIERGPPAGPSSTSEPSASRRCVNLASFADGVAGAGVAGSGAASATSSVGASASGVTSDTSAGVLSPSSDGASATGDAGGALPSLISQYARPPPARRTTAAATAIGANRDPFLASRT